MQQHQGCTNLHTKIIRPHHLIAIRMLWQAISIMRYFLHLVIHHLTQLLTHRVLQHLLLHHIIVAVHRLVGLGHQQRRHPQVVAITIITLLEVTQQPLLFKPLNLQAIQLPLLQTLQMQLKQ